MMIAEILAERIASVRFEALPDDAVHWARVAILDTVGCTLAGASEPCARIVAGEYPTPDLLVIDGGRGQVSVAAEVLAEQGLHQTPLIGLAKGPERKPGLEDIVFPNREAVLNLPSDHPGLHLLQQIRDEAHRFAIQGHRARRAKTRNTSSLQEISGIGAKRRQALLAHFGGLKGMQSASIEDLARVPGISHALAERIYAQLH